ncbi:MAG: hypothetical protein HY815_10880 [Candidatus Riflebacteria bacterium]|nr:hypothetical protein [Candidatus Riflebacteria bacterium]
MQRGLHRLTVWTLVAALLLGPLSPLLEAQDVNFAPGTAEYENFTSQVRDRLASREGLEQLYQRAAVRQSQLQTDLQTLQTMQAPPGTDPTVWQQRFQEQAQRLKDEMTRNDAIVDRTRKKLGPIYTKLQSDLERIKSSNNDALNQQIGTLIGAGGGTVVPIWNRMTAADISGMARYGVNQAHLATVNPRINAYNNIATNAASRAANAEAALGGIQTVRWTPEPSTAGTNMVLTPRDAATGEVIASMKPIETNVPAKITNSQGTVVDNPNAVAAGNDLAQLYNSRTQIANELQATRLKLSRGVNNVQKEFFEKHAAGLEQKKVALEADIQKYQSENPSIGTRAKGLAMDAGKWAAMSVGITLGANVIHQLTQNGWDPSKINWRQAGAFLTDGHFWGGTAGSFVGSLAGTAIASALPGGIFVKTALSIGGAALGFQWGSGNLGKTDWAALGVTTLGSTAGFLIGMAIGGPVGAFLGGIIGQLASQYIYDKVKEWLIREEGASSYDQSQGQSQAQAQVQVGYPAVGDPGPVLPPAGLAGQTGGYAGPAPTETGYGGQASGGDAAARDVTERMNGAYVTYLEAQRVGNTQLAAQKLQEYQALRTQLQGLRQNMAPAGPGDYHNSSGQ